MRTYPHVLASLACLAAGCGGTLLSPPSTSHRSPMAVSPQAAAPATFNQRVRSLAEAPPTAVHDSLLRDRVRLVALSNDPEICAHLRDASGTAGSSTVFALMAGAATEDYTAGANLHEVMTAALGFSPVGPVATVTAQLLDGTCQLVKPDKASDTREVATAGHIHFSPKPSGAGEGSYDLTLRDDPAPLHGQFVSQACPGLLKSIMELIPVAQAEEETVSALKCL